MSERVSRGPIPTKGETSFADQVSTNSSFSRNRPSLTSHPVTDLSSWIDRLYHTPLPPQNDRNPIAAWFEMLSAEEKDLVEAVSEAVWSLTDQEKHMLYTSCSEEERRMIGVCCLIFEAET